MEIHDPEIIIPTIEADISIVTKRTIAFRELIPERGTLREYYDYAKELTDSPEHFHLFVGMGIIGTAIGRNAWIPFGAVNLYPNIFMVLLASSSFYRKSTSLSIGRDLLRQTFTNMAMPEHLTLEKMFDILERSPTACFFPMEFASFIGMTERSYNEGMMSIITELFDNPPDYKRSTKGGGDQVIEKPFTSILSASTFEWFNKKIKQSDIYGGFLARFIFVPAYKRSNFMAFPPEKDVVKTKKLKKSLGSIARIKGKVVFNDDCKRIYTNWLKAHEDQLMNHPKEGLLSGFMTRLAVYALKFSMIYHLSENTSLELKPQSIYRGILAVEYLKAKLFKLADETFSTPLDRELRRAYNHIKKGGGITMRDFYRSMGIRSREANLVRDDLLARDLIYFKDGKMQVKGDF